VELAGVAVAVVAGAWLAPPLAWPAALIAGLALAVAGVAGRRPIALAVGGFVLAAGLAGHAWSGLRPLPAATFEGVVTLRSDPAPFGVGVTAEAVSNGRHVQLRAFGGPARRLQARQAGERLLVEGRSGPLGPRDLWLRTRHIVGMVQVTRVSVVGDAGPLARSANRLRGLLARGARTMTPLDRSLYLGFVIGDDRAQPPAVIEQFRASGLAHLSAVSGENVAFLLAVAGPGLRRLGGPARWGVTLLLIGWFAVITRFEPSVIRASVMAALACTAVALGRPAGTTRLLSLTVVGVLLADPLLVRDVGWWLSVGATAGIAVLARPLAARLPGPAPLRAGLAVTISAQLGVAPVSVVAFGPLPVASVPANLLAVPAAGPVMVYGLPVGLVCAALPEPVTQLFQVPTVVLVRWIARVAAWGAAAPLPALGGPAMVGVAIAVAVVLCRPPRHRR
jgi:competence protein ComEC